MFIESPDPVRARRRLRSNLETISFVTQEYGHTSCWDFETMATYLHESGFQHVEQVGFRSGRCEKLLIDLDSEDRKLVSLYVEATKT